MPRKSAANRNRLPFEDISNKLEDDSTYEDDDDYYDEAIVTRRRGKLSECSEYEPVPDDGDTCSSLIISSMDFEDSNSCDYRFSDFTKAPLKIKEDQDSESETLIPSSSGEAMFSGEKKKKPFVNALPSPDIELARFTSTPVAVQSSLVSSFFTLDSKAAIPFAGFSSPDSLDSNIFSPFAPTKAPTEAVKAANVSFLVEPEFQRILRKRPIPDWGLEKSEGEPLSKKQKLAIEKPAKLIASPEFYSMPKNNKTDLSKRAETLFSPTKGAMPGFNLFCTTKRTPKRYLTEVPRDYSPNTSSAPQDLRPEDFKKMLRGDFSGQLFKKMLIFDCRYMYEYRAGHFKNAINANFDGNWQEVVKRNTFEEESISSQGQETVIVFHCEYSKRRGKAEMKWFRGKDRDVNRYPELTFPHVRLLEGGFKKFWCQLNFEEAPAGTYATSQDSGIPSYVSEFDKNHIKSQKASRKAEEKTKRENKPRNQSFFNEGPSSCTRSKDRHLRSSSRLEATPDQSRNRSVKKNTNKKSCKKQLF
ncbi:unnamed protein product [Oikopleura dioica]|uniref:protein-tyrosine-phosphatase n=1 Tax=Oikopleura dioica TaxID=34765 RepID=E4XCH5_OIKDI|nr:unnamed protein product [Oikopleura dioica]